MKTTCRSATKDCISGIRFLNSMNMMQREMGNGEREVLAS